VYTDSELYSGVFEIEAVSFNYEEEKWYVKTSYGLTSISDSIAQQFIAGKISSVMIVEI